MKSTIDLTRSVSLVHPEGGADKQRRDACDECSEPMIKPITFLDRLLASNSAKLSALEVERIGNPAIHRKCLLNGRSLAAPTCKLGMYVQKSVEG